MKRDPKAVYDGFTVIQGGVNSGQPPAALPRTQVSWAVNTSFRGYYATPRPGFTKRTLLFRTSANVEDATLRANFEDNVFSGATCYESRNQIVALIGGRLFAIKLDSWKVVDVSPVLTIDPAVTYDLGPNNRYRAWFAEAEGFMIAQDGTSAPWIYDGNVSRRSDTFGSSGNIEVPVGTAMTYSSGRLIVALADGKQFVIGDLTGNTDSGTYHYNYRDAVLKFTENLVIGEGGAFSIPINAGSLTALRPVAQLDTSTGQGPTQIFTPSAIFSLNIPADRTTWVNLTYPIGTVSMIGGGSTSDRATQLVNGDIWFRAPDGVRSFVVGRRDFGTWVNAPLSEEVNRAISSDDKHLLGYASQATFDKRLLTTVRPYRVWDHGICHQGIAALDFAPVSYMGQRSNPVWDGVWTGLNILQVLSGTYDGVERAFIFALDDSNNIVLYEITKDRTSDYDGTSNVDIAWVIETSSYNFPRQPTSLLPTYDLYSLDGGYLTIDRIDGDVVIDSYYRPDQDPVWRSWNQFSVCATTETCGTGTCLTPGEPQQQYRQPLNLGSPLGTEDVASAKPTNIGRDFQVRFGITGYCRIKRLELMAHQQPEDVASEPASDEACQTVDSCPDSDYTYSIE